jgi:hypothetical protein
MATCSAGAGGWFLSCRTMPELLMWVGVSLYLSVGEILSRSRERCQAFKAFLEQEGWAGRSMLRRDFTDLFMVACDISGSSAFQHVVQGHALGLWSISTTLPSQARLARILLLAGADLPQQGERSDTPWEQVPSLHAPSSAPLGGGRGVTTG